MTSEVLDKTPSVPPEVSTCVLALSRQLLVSYYYFFKEFIKKQLSCKEWRALSYLSVQTMAVILGYSLDRIFDKWRHTLDQRSSFNSLANKKYIAQFAPRKKCAQRYELERFCVRGVWKLQYDSNKALTEFSTTFIFYGLASARHYRPR